MSETTTKTPESRRMSRRGLLKTVGVGVGAAATGGLGLSQGVEETEALDLGVIAATGGVGAAASAAVDIAWALRDGWNPLASDSPPDGLSASALKQRVRQTARTRKSTNASTIVDNQNIIASGLENNLYTRGKTAAVEALNAGKTQSEVQTAAIDAMESHLTTIQKNLFKSWNESVNELETLISALSSHSGTAVSDVFDGYYLNDGWMDYDSDQSVVVPDSVTSVSLADGTAMDITPLSVTSRSWSPVSISVNNTNDAAVFVKGPDVRYLVHSDWNGVWSDLQTVKTNVNDGLVTWVENVYGQVQSGELSLGDLTTPRMRANQMAEEQGGEANAIADLQALNIPIAAGEQTTIEVEKSEATLELSGTLAYTGEMTMQPGTTYDPSSWSDGAVAYFTYDKSTASGTWNAYQTPVDGGIVSFTSEPTDGVAYRISTAANESVTVQGGDFTPVDASGSEVDPTSTTPDHWEVDLSGELATPITEVASVKIASTTTESETTTIILDDPFTITSIKRDGSDVDSATFEQTEPQTDSNYITQEEWEQMEQRNQELIEQYEQSQNSGGGLTIPSLGGLGDSGGLLGGAVVVLGGLGILNWLSN